MLRLKGELEIGLVEKRYSTEHKDRLHAEEILASLLNDERFPRRRFETIRNIVGGYSDDELRKLLLRAGGIRMMHNGDELWTVNQRARTRD